MNTTSSTRDASNNTLPPSTVPSLDQIRDQQQATWDRFSAGWKKWDAHVLPWLAPVGAALLEAAHLRPDAHVLDVASGTGEPGLSAAARCPQGRVVVTDLAEGMLRVAAENAARRGLGNVITRQADAGNLPFATGSFDAVMARFGFMFFPDVVGAARELARVARPGARVTTAVWAAPANNPWATLIMDTIARHVDLPKPPPGAPGLFRCAAPGYMADVFRQVGLRNVSEIAVETPATFADAAEYFSFMTEVAAPVVAGMAKADDAARATIRDEVVRLASARADAAGGGRVTLGATALVITGER